MRNILNLQKMDSQLLMAETVGNSNGSSTCVGVSCTSNGCVPQETEEPGCGC